MLGFYPHEPKQKNFGSGKPKENPSEKAHKAKGEEGESGGHLSIINVHERYE